MEDERQSILKKLVEDGKPLKLSREDDVEGRLIFGDLWEQMKESMEPGAVYELSYEEIDGDVR